MWISETDDVVKKFRWLMVKHHDQVKQVTFGWDTGRAGAEIEE